MVKDFKGSIEIEVDEYQVLIDQYRQGIPAKILEIQNAYRIKEWESLKVLVHKLAGSSSMYGFYEISSIAENLENAINNENFEKVDIEMQNISIFKSF